MRQAAAHALRDTRSQRALAALILGLYNSDFEVRYYAVIGLAEITGTPQWRPLESDFKARESEYLTYWKSWGATQSGTKPPSQPGPRF